MAFQWQIQGIIPFDFRKKQENWKFSAIQEKIR